MSYEKDLNRKGRLTHAVTDEPCVGNKSIRRVWVLFSIPITAKETGRDIKTKVPTALEGGRRTYKLQYQRRRKVDFVL